MADRGDVETALPPTMRHGDLLECLLLVARTHGELPNRDTLLAGLPVEQGVLTPALFERAARNAHLSSHIVRTTLKGIKRALLPAVVLLEGNHACVLLEWSSDGRQARLLYPEFGGAAVMVPVEELESGYAGSVIYARPLQRFDARIPQVQAGRHGHWFWGVIAENRALYRDVLLAAFLANLFALGMPLFTMNVYDRVVPNRAFDTLWVLAFGLLLMLVSDLVLRTMRNRFVDLASARADVKLSAFIMERVLGRGGH